MPGYSCHAAGVVVKDPMARVSFCVMPWLAF